MSTPLSELLTAVSAYGTLKAVKWLEGEEEMALPEEELTGFAARRDIEDHDLTRKEWDQVVDTYLESVKTEMARRLTPSDPDACESATSMEQFRIAHRAQIKLLREKLKDCESALERAERSPAASGVIPAPLVPDAVKVALEALERIKNWHCDCTWPESYRDDVRAVAESALSALRLLTVEGGSVCEVEPLGEVEKFLHEADQFIERCQTMLSVNAPQMAADAAQDAGYSISCADRALAKLKRLPPSPPSSEDTQEFTDSERLEHLMRFTSPPVDRAKLDRCIRSEREASTTTQKGGQGV